jgi:hypothetical protein
MPKSSPAAPVNPAEEKWKQQVRLACVQAVSARAVASNVAYNATSIIDAAKILVDFVLQSD